MWKQVPDRGQKLPRTGLETPARLPEESDSLKSSAERRVYRVWTPEPQGPELAEPEDSRKSRTTPSTGRCVAEPQLKKKNHADKMNKDHQLGTREMAQ